MRLIVSTTRAEKPTKKCERLFSSLYHTCMNIWVITVGRGAKAEKRIGGQMFFAFKHKWRPMVELDIFRGYVVTVT